MDDKSRELQRVIDYDFKNESHLNEALNVTKTKRGKNKKTYYNEALACVGDAVLKTVLADYIYWDLKNSNSPLDKAVITERKEQLESDGPLCYVSETLHLVDYAFNDDQTELPTGKHDRYVEALVGAIFHDGGFESAKQWILRFLLPKLQEFEKIAVQ